MPYAAEISRNCPTAFLLVIDQSGSMGDAWGDGLTKANAVCDALNRLLYELIQKCSKDAGVRHYFDVGVIGYGGTGVADALSFVPGGVLKQIMLLEQNPRRIEERTQRLPDGAGGLIETKIKFPVWFEPVYDGGTPMCEGLRLAATEIGEWCDAHPQAFPPTVLHITDGESTDGDPTPIAELMQQLATQDGSILLFNLHISSAAGSRLIFPADAQNTPNPTAKQLFQMSSPLPSMMIEAAKGKGYEVSSGSRGYGYNADFSDLVSFFDIGTRAANLAR